MGSSNRRLGSVGARCRTWLVQWLPRRYAKQYFEKGPLGEQSSFPFVARAETFKSYLGTSCGNYTGAHFLINTVYSLDNAVYILAQPRHVQHDQNQNADHYYKKIFRTEEQKIKTGTDPTLNLVSPTRFDVLLRAILTLLAAVLLLVPVLILFELQPENASQVKSRSKYQVLTIFLFTLIASASCSIFTKARKQEVFTATAAYCAVLVVFLGNTSQVMVVSSGS